MKAQNCSNNSDTLRKEYGTTITVSFYITKTVFFTGVQEFVQSSEKMESRVFTLGSMIKTSQKKV